MRLLLQNAIKHRRAVYVIVIPVVGDESELATDVSETTINRRRTSFKCGRWIYTYLLNPLFGFACIYKHDNDDQLAMEHSAWLEKYKWDALFVKRYGCLFEDTHGPPVVRVHFRFAVPQDSGAIDGDDGTVGSLSNDRCRRSRRSRTANIWNNFCRNKNGLVCSNN